MSGETKWTPGPWRAELSGVEYTVEGCGNPRGTVAVITARVPSETALADAHLIAAATDMAEALRPFAEAATLYGERRYPDGHGVRIKLGDLRRARAALAKAEGRS